jgi:cobalt-zinc-cadmium efflux system protein
MRVALLLALMAVHFARRKPDTRHTFGYLRLTTLAAFANAATLLLIVVFITFEAIRRFFTPQHITGSTMLIVAIAGLLANIFAFWVLHKNIEEKSMNMRAAALHVLGDLLGSVGAIVASVIIMATGWMIIDPILSVLVSALILHNAWKLLTESFHELLEGASQAIDVNTLYQDLCLHIPQVTNVHHVHLWQVGEQRLMTLHVQVMPGEDHDLLLQSIQHHLLEHYQICHATVQIEYQHCQKPDCDIHQTTSGAHVHQH